MGVSDGSVKICLVSSSGGHFEQLIRLLPLLDKYSGYVVTEDTGYEINLPGRRVYRAPSMDRTDRGIIWELAAATRAAWRILREERPDVIISTGALPALPTLVLGKLLGSKVVYLESFAKVSTPNKAGRLVYLFADRFYVQWEPMLKHYPKAIYKGGIY